MDKKQEQKLERYLRNANRFIWGLGKVDQKNTYEWLEINGFTDDGSRFKSSYSDTTEKLIKNYGIERIMRDILKQRIHEMYGINILDWLRNCWVAGVRPTVDMLKANNFLYILDERKVIKKDIDRDPEPFMRYNRQFNYIEGWGDFAGVWFEEIEPWLEESKNTG
ncbi:hypothetical protein ACFLXC_03655 [Chloroflexota bacterium]